VRQHFSGKSAVQRPRRKRNRARAPAREGDVPAVPEPPHAAPADMVEHKIDQALDMTFPASDPPAWGFLHARARGDSKQRSAVGRQAAACTA
jgi:hypothetical protein